MTGGNNKSCSHAARGAMLRLKFLLSFLAAPTSALLLTTAGRSTGSSAAAERSARAPPPVCGPRVRIVTVGKTKDAALAGAIETYVTRLRGVLAIEQLAVRDDAALCAQVARCSEPCIVLDERGAQPASSVAFSERVYRGLEEGGSRLTFAIGGADGLPAELKADRGRLLSLGQLTFPHQIAKLLLVEQLYRAAEIRRGSQYHKDYVVRSRD